MRVSLNIPFIPHLTSKQSSIISITSVVLAILFACAAVLVHLLCVGTITGALLGGGAGLFFFVALAILGVYLLQRKTKEQIKEQQISSDSEAPEELNTKEFSQLYKSQGSKSDSSHDSTPQIQQSPPNLLKQEISQPQSQKVTSSPPPKQKTTLSKPQQMDVPKLLQQPLEDPPLLEITVENFSIQGTFVRSIMEGTREEVERSLQNGMQINQEIYKGLTALQLAILYNKEEIIQLLVKQGANINQRSNKGGTALHYAARVNALALLIKWIIEGAADPTIYDNEGKYYYEFINKNKIYAFIDQYKLVSITEKNEHLETLLTQSPEEISKDSISFRPTEILLEIFRYLPSKQLALCEQVSKTWNMYIKNLWPEYVKKDQTLFPKISSPVRFNNFSIENFHNSPTITSFGSSFDGSKGLIHRGVLYYLQGGEIYCISDENQKFRTIESKKIVGDFIIFGEYLIVGYDDSTIQAYHLTNANQYSLSNEAKASFRFLIDPDLFFVDQGHMMILNNDQMLDVYSTDLKKIYSFKINQNPKEIKIAQNLLVFRTKKIIQIWSMKEAQCLVEFKVEQYCEIDGENEWAAFTIQGKMLIAVTNKGRLCSCDLSNFFLQNDFLFFFKESKIEIPHLTKFSMRRIDKDRSDK